MPGGSWPDPGQGRAQSCEDRRDLEQHPNRFWRPRMEATPYLGTCRIRVPVEKRAAARCLELEFASSAADVQLKQGRFVLGNDAASVPGLVEGESPGLMGLRVANGRLPERFRPHRGAP